jgi:hypothetical protein
VAANQRKTNRLSAWISVKLRLCCSQAAKRGRILREQSEAGYPIAKHPAEVRWMDGALRDCLLAQLTEKILFFCGLLNVNLRNRKLSLA